MAAAACRWRVRDERPLGYGAFWLIFVPAVASFSFIMGGGLPAIVKVGGWVDGLGEDEQWRVTVTGMSL